MGKQINFYMDSISQDLFNQFLEESGFTQLDISSNKIEIRNTNVTSAYLYKQCYGSLIKNNDSTRIDIIKSPIIEYKRTVIKEEQRRICRGRLWVENKFYSENGAILSKNEELLKDYQLLARWIKKHIPYREIPKGQYQVREYVSSSLDDMLTNGYIFSI